MLASLKVFPSAVCTLATHLQNHSFVARNPRSLIQHFEAGTQSAMVKSARPTSRFHNVFFCGAHLGAAMNSLTCDVLMSTPFSPTGRTNDAIRRFGDSFAPEPWVLPLPGEP